MRATINTETITITCGFQDLAKMADMHYAVYATPMLQGLANQVYLGQRPQYKYDFLLATLEDFEQELGYEIDTEDMDEADWEAQEDLEVTITVPRTRPTRNV